MKYYSQHLIVAVLTLMLAAGCGESKEQRTEGQAASPAQNRAQGRNLTGAQNQAPPARNWGEVQPGSGDVRNLAASVDLSGLSDIEKEILQRTFALQQPFYDRQLQWADSAGRIVEGEAAAAALEQYIRNLDSFARQMEKLDAEMAVKLDPGFTGSEEFDRVLEEYIARSQVTRKTEIITKAYVGLLNRFREHPACKDIFAKLERMSRQRR